MPNSDDLSDVILGCIKIFDETSAFYQIGNSLSSELEDNLTPVLNKTELIDIVHEVADSVRIKKAQSSFMQRHVEQDSD
ncbi:MAG: hypothetical protein ACREA3_01530 [Nitrosotalea sp.]